MFPKLQANESSAEGPGIADLAPVEAISLLELRNVVVQLIHAVRGALREDDDEIRISLARASELLRLAPDVGTDSEALMRGSIPSASIRGGLAPWQVRKIATFVESHLDSTIHTYDLAKLVRLSRFHFCRAFRQSFGVSPREYIMRRRIELAQGLMLTSSMSLGQIAAESGLPDQAYLNKLFRRFVGESPGAWKRARVTGLQRTEELGCARASTMQSDAHAASKLCPARTLLAY